MGLREFLPDLASWGALARERVALRGVTDLFQELEECLLAGWVPAEGQWKKLRELPEPWAMLSSESVEGLRQNGGAVLPTLKRLRVLAQEHEAALGHAQAKSSQALAQALACGTLVPFFGLALGYFLPGISEQRVRWALAMSIALGGNAIGAIWLLLMAEQARWAGLPHSMRSWVLAAQCAGERFLSLLRAGQPADLAWTRAVQGLSPGMSRLVELWGSSPWAAGCDPKGSEERIFSELGRGIRRAIQVSLMEGRPCTERVEGALSAFSSDLRARTERELTLLGTRALQPLFLCVAPSLLGLLAYGVFLAWDAMEEGF